MGKKYHLKEELFPIIRQLLKDGFHLDSYLVSYPYKNMEEIDRGLRKALFKEYDSSPDVFKTWGFKQGEYAFFIIKSTLKFYNVIAIFPNKEKPECPSFLTVGPFRSEEVNIGFLQEIVQTNNLAEEHISFLRYYYQALPMVDYNDIAVTVLHLIQSFVPEFKDVEIKTINYSEIRKVVELDTNRIEMYSSDYLKALDNNLKDVVEVVKTGDTTRAMQQISLFINAAGINQMSRVSVLRKYCSILNYLLYYAATDSFVHPSYAIRRLSDFEQMIDGTQNYRTLQHLPFDIVHKYTILIKNYSHQDYSQLVRNIVDYIDLNLAEELSLTSISQKFNKNQSYISTTFKNEVGTGLANYIASERIRVAVKLLNTTDKSIGEIASSVGIDDFGYFTKLFKKNIGKTPTEYRKMMQ